MTWTAHILWKIWMIRSWDFVTGDSLSLRVRKCKGLRWVDQCITMYSIYKDPQTNEIILNPFLIFCIRWWFFCRPSFYIIHFARGSSKQKRHERLRPESHRGSSPGLPDQLQTCSETGRNRHRLQQSDFRASVCNVSEHSKHSWSLMNANFWWNWSSSLVYLQSLLFSFQQPHTLKFGLTRRSLDQRQQYDAICK